MSRRRRIRALVLAVALAFALAAPAAASASARPEVTAAVNVGPVRALRLMGDGWWCERTAPGRFACVRHLDPYAIVGPVTSLGDLRWFLDHDFACAGETWHPSPQWWDCTPS